MFSVAGKRSTLFSSESTKFNFRVFLHLRDVWRPIPHIPRFQEVEE